MNYKEKKMDKIPLTPKQKEILDFITIFYNSYHYMPTQKEIGEGYIGDNQTIKSRTARAAGVALNRLEQRGWIKIAKGKARAIQLL
jgi:SOS-response transcriptional repressor LexA